MPWSARMRASGVRMMMLKKPWMVFFHSLLTPELRVENGNISVLIMHAVVAVFFL